MELNKAQKQGRDYTTQKKTNLTHEEYPVYVFHTLNGIMDRCRVLFLVLG